MKLRKTSSILALILCLVTAAGAFGAGRAAAAPSGDHLPTIKNPTSARFDMVGNISTSGGAIPISGSGAISGNDVTLDMEMTAPAGASGPATISFSMVALGDKLYFKMSGISPESDDKWYVTDYEGAPGMGMMTGIDMQAMHDAVTITGTTKETIHGVATTRYTMEVDTAALTPTGQNPAPEGASVETTLALTMWVGDSDRYVHKLMLDMEAVATVGETTSAVGVDFTMTFSAFDTALAITAPANAEPLDLDMATMPGSPLGGILEGMTAGMGTGMPRTGSGDAGSPWLPALLALGIATLTGGVMLRRRAARVWAAA